MVKPMIRPSKTCLTPYISSSRSTCWPIRNLRSRASLQFASIQISRSAWLGVQPDSNARLVTVFQRLRHLCFGDLPCCASFVVFLLAHSLRCEQAFSTFKLLLGEY